MAITLGNVTFDRAHTTVREKHEEVGGRNARRIEITGLIVGKHSIEDIEAEFDAVLDAASADGYTAELSLREERRLWVQRTTFVRGVSRETLVGSFTLGLDARDPFEESTTLEAVPWSITASGATTSVASGGNVFSVPTITLAASGDVINPSFSDGTRTLTYWGTVEDGQTLVLDGPAAVVTLEGEDVTPYTTGVFPRIAPEGAVLTYSDDDSSSHTALVTVAFRDRWW